MARERKSGGDRPRRRGRWFRAGAILVVGLALLALAALLVIDVVRRSQFVADMVIAKVQEATGLVVTAGDLSIGWGGTTVLEDLVLTQPLSDEPAVTVERLVVEHDGLLWVIARRNLQIESIRIERPVLLAREDPAAAEPVIGWSLGDAARRILASLPASDGGSTGPPNIPAVTIIDGRLVLAPAEGDRLPLDIAARIQKPNPLALAFEVTISDLLAAEGEAALGGEWTHRAQLRLEPTDPVWAQVSRLLNIQQLERPQASLRWAGAMRNGQIAGALRIEQASVGEIAAAGSVNVRAGQTLWAEPEALRVTYADKPPVLLQEGEVLLEGAQATLRGVTVEAFDQVVRLDGRADLEALAGTADISFRGRAGGLLSHRGSATLEVQSPAGRPVIDATVSARGESPTGAFVARADFHADGPDWRNIAGRLELPTLRYRSGDTTWDASGLAIAAALDETGVALEGAEIPHARSSTVTGDLRFESLVWSLHARITDWRPLADGPDFDLALGGDGRGGEVQEFTIEGGDEAVRFSGQGAYDPALPRPIALALDVVVDRQEMFAEAAEAAEAEAEADPRPASVIPADLYGAITGNFELDGTLKPLVLGGQARMLTRGVRFREVAFNDMELLGTAEFREGGGTFSSEEFALLDGKASLVARTDLRGNVEARAVVDGVDLGTIGALLALDTPIQGRAGAVIEAEIPEGKPSDLTARAEWRVDQFAASIVGIERAAGVARYERGVVELDDTTISNGDGEIRARATVPLDNLSRVRAEAVADAFAVDLGGATASISGQAAGFVDVLNRAGDIDLDGALTISLQDHAVAAINARGGLAGRTLELERIDGHIGGGDLAGVAIIPFDALTESTAKLTLHELEPRYFATIWPQATEVTGRVSGDLVLAPTTEQHAPEPLRLDVDLGLTEGAWRSVAVKDLNIRAYIGEERALIHRATAEVGDGVVELWGSTSDHAGDRYVQLSGTVRAVDLQQVVSAVAPDADEYEGVVSASFSAGGYVGLPHRLFGDAVVTVAESDLIAIPVINELYSLFRVQASDETSGMGIAEMRLEGRSLHITRADYFNRGLELRASLDIADIFLGKDSPIIGIGVGTARPLAGSKLSLTAGADRMLSAAQAGGTIARIDGTLGEPEAKVVAMAELQEFISRLLGPLGD